MPTLNPNLAYTLPAVREALVARDPLPQGWLRALIAAINAHFESPPSFDLAIRMNEHLGDESIYTMKEQLIEGLKVIYWVMIDPETSPDHQLSIAFKLIERAEYCTPGFHDGVNSLVDGLVRPASLDELLYRIRHDIVSKTANQSTHEVHSNNRFYTLAQNAGYGVRALNLGDVHTGEMSDEDIYQRISDAFALDYRLFVVLRGMEDQIRSELFRLDYSEKREAGYQSVRMEPLLDFLTILFKDAPAVIKQGDAIAEQQEYKQRIHEAMDRMRPAVRAFIPALTNENFVDALIKGTFPEHLKGKYINGLDDNTQIEIAKIQQDYKQVLSSEDMKALAARINESTDDRVSPFQSTEGGNLHLNWHQIRQILWEEFRKQRYFTLTEQEEIAFNGLVDNRLPLKTEYCNILALSRAEVIALLSLSILSDDKKKGLLHWYIREAEEILEDKFNSLPAIQALGKYDEAIHVALNELAPHLSALKEPLRQDWLSWMNGQLAHLQYDYNPPTLPRLLREDKAFMLAAMVQHFWVLDQASTALRADPEFMLVVVSRNGSAIKHASDELKANRDIVLAAVRQDGEALQYASAEFQADWEISLAAVGQNFMVLPLVSPALMNNRAFFLAMVSQYAGSLAFASAEFQADWDIVLAAVRQSAFTLVFASPELKADREFLLAAISQNGKALLYTSVAWQADREFVLAAVRRNDSAFQYASQTLQQDTEIILATMPSAASFEETEAPLNLLDIRTNVNYGFFDKKPTSYLTAGQIERINAHLPTLGQELKASPDAIIKGQKQREIKALQALKTLSQTMDVVSALQRIEDGGLFKYADAGEGSRTQALMDEIRGENSSLSLKK